MGSGARDTICPTVGVCANRRRSGVKALVIKVPGAKFEFSGGTGRGLSWSSHQYRYRVPERPPGIVSFMDRPLLYISIALASTLLLFAVGVFPYPFGLIVLTLLALGRFLQIKGQA